MMSKKELERLEFLEKEIRKIAEAEGLSTTDVIFEIVPASRVIEGMAYSFPVNFSHWTHGRNYDRYRTIYEHTGRGIPYEQVWNFDVPKALLVETNPFVVQALVIAHVYGHVDFFLNSRYLTLGRKFTDVAAEARSAADRFRNYEERFGAEQVEAVMDAALSIQWHQNPDIFSEETDEEDLRTRLIEIEQAKLLADIRPQNPTQKPLTPEEIQQAETRIKRLTYRTPPMPTMDLLGYIISHSPRPLKSWQADILSVIRSQARALIPNTRTKMLNEGWASYWHVRIMRKLFESDLLTAEEHGVYNQFHSSITQAWTKGFNWYRIGFGLYEHVKERWDKGRFGKEYEDCPDQYKRAHWDTGAGLGKQKIFEVRAAYSDRMAIEQLFTDDFIRSQEIYLYEEAESGNDIIDVIVERDPEVIREVLKQSVGPHIPQITVEDGNLNGSNELLLKHHFTGYELDPVYCELTLRNICTLWGRPVLLETVREDEWILLRHNGQKIEVADHQRIRQR